uniref:FBA domain-containing protein n=1 Tax=Panagrellus redivivus TaxID=6233 RepID=A0A7E4VTJ2_PANRE
MPYSLLKLPYGLQRRLRSLANPKETYNLQVAIGHQKSYLHPHQMCFTKCSYYLCIINKGGNIILTDTSPWFNINEVLDWKNGSLRPREDPGFYLTLNCWHPPTNAARRIRQKFGPHFQEFKSNGHGRFEKGFLIIKFGNKRAGEGYFALPTPEVITRFFFQVVPLTVN